MRKIKTLGAALLVATVLVTGANAASYAATGHGFILGASNSANTLTSLTRTTSGPALNLHTRLSSNYPFQTNATGKVVNLNADKVDNYDGTAMLNRTRLFSLPISITGASQFTVTVPSVPAGNYQFSSNGFIYTSMANAVACELTVPSTSQNIYEWFPIDASSFFMPNGDGIVKVPTTQDLTYRCYNNGGMSSNWSSLSTQPLQLALSPIGQLINGTASAARVGAARVGAAHSATR